MTLTKKGAEMLLKCALDKFVPPKGYIGLCNNMEVATGRINGEPCIGPKTNYYRIPYDREKDFTTKYVEGKLIMTNRRKFFFGQVPFMKRWKKINGGFFAETADRPFGVNYFYFNNCYGEFPMTIEEGSTALFAEGDLEVILDF